MNVLQEVEIKLGQLKLFAALIIAGTIITSFLNAASAQIVPDTTLGNENSIVTPNTNVRGLPATLIEGGATRGVNLFQSFSQFNVGDGQRVYFANPTGIENILTRVTGNNPSNIFGNLGVDGHANLFLLNPNGIIFGQNARLDVAGSFFATTADSFLFDNGMKFSATNPEVPPLLMINVPIGLQLSTSSGSISNSGILKVGQDLTLAGGNLDLQGQLNAGKDLILKAEDTVKIRDSVASPFFGSAGGNLTIQGNQEVDIFGLNNIKLGLFSGRNINLFSKSIIINNALINTSCLAANDSGNIFIGNSYQNHINNDISIENTTLNSSNNGTGYAGAIVLNASNQISIINSGILSNGNFGRIFLGTIPNTSSLFSMPNSININNSTLSASNTGTGYAGYIVLNAHEQISLRNSSIFSDGNFGRIFLGTNPDTSSSFPIPNSINIDNSTLSASNSGTGYAGDIVINASEQITMTNSDISSDGKFGLIYIGKNDDYNQSFSPKRVSLDGSYILTTNLGITNFDNEQINSGNISVNAIESISLVNQSLITTATWKQGNAGQINLQIEKGSLTVSNGSKLNSDTFGQGDAGNINIEAKNGTVIFDGFPVDNQGQPILSSASQASSSVNNGAVGKGGNINITANSLSLSNGAYLFTTTSGKAQSELERADAGNITINVDDAVNVTNGAWLASDTLGEGNGGNITINADGAVTFDGLLRDQHGNPIIENNVLFKSQATTSVGGNLQPELFANRKGGDITIKASSLYMNDFSSLSTATFAEGNAGKISIQVDDFVTLNNLSQIRSNVERGGVGIGGDINIKARSLTLTNGSEIGAAVFREGDGQNGGKGRAGNIDITATDFVDISGVSSVQLPIPEATAGFSSGIFASAERGTTATSSQAAGNITITTQDFRIAGGGLVNALTSNTGNGGDITINAKNFTATSGGQVITTTRGAGRAGNIKLNVSDQITISGSDPNYNQRLQAAAKFGDPTDVVNNQGANSGIFANTANNSTGQGGNINIDPILIILENGGAIAANSQGTGAAGNITLQSNRLILNNGNITTATTSTDGGNITFNLQDLLLLRNGSQISATAGTQNAGGNGGNIIINIPQGFLVASPSENSDITANAFTGNGGQVNITTQGIFGIQARQQLSNSSDITASSEFGSSGEILLNTLDVDPASGLTSLPEDLVDPSNKIDQGCTAFNNQQASEFKITGRGGLPPNPDQPLNSNTVWEDTRILNAQPEKLASQTTIITPQSRDNQNQIIPATAWVFNHNGEVTLISSTPTGTPEKFGSTPPSCTSR